MMMLSSPLLMLLPAAPPQAALAPTELLLLNLDLLKSPRFRQAAAFFTAAPHGFNNNGSLLPPLLSDLQSLGEARLLGWDGVGDALRTEPLTDTVTTVRILGGWGPSRPCREELPIPGCVSTPAQRGCCTNNATGARQPCCSPVQWSDIAYREAGGRLGYRWDVLWARLDPLVNNSIRTVFVLDNVDYVFVRDASIGKYGQSLAPDDLTEYLL
jgi:hypothetical protein